MGNAAGMAQEKLQIKVFSEAGAIANLLNCFAGQVTVLRAKSSEALVPFQDILFGRAQVRNMQVLLDDQHYNAADQFLVGSGSPMISGEGGVIDYLVSAGVANDLALRSLDMYGLASFSFRKCRDLSTCQATRLALLAAVHGKAAVAVLDDPFKNITPEWREKFGELISSGAALQGKIIVVTSLTVRPECWIDNLQIVRVQIDDARHKTIGFGGDAHDLNVLVRQLRQSLKEEVDLKQRLAVGEKEGVSKGSSSLRAGWAALFEKKPIPATDAKVSNLQLQNTVTLTYKNYRSFFSLLLIGALLLAIFIRYRSISLIDPSFTEDPSLQEAAVDFPSRKPGNAARVSDDRTKAANNKTVESADLADPDIAAAAGEEEQPAMTTVETIARIEPPKLPERYVLDGYSSEIKEAVVAAFRGAGADNQPGLVGSRYVLAGQPKEEGAALQGEQPTAQRNAPTAGRGKEFLKSLSVVGDEGERTSSKAVPAIAKEDNPEIEALRRKLENVFQEAIKVE